jgi:hypothetical protein
MPIDFNAVSNVLIGSFTNIVPPTLSNLLSSECPFKIGDIVTAKSSCPPGYTVTCNGIPVKILSFKSEGFMAVEVMSHPSRKYLHTEWDVSSQYFELYTPVKTGLAQFVEMQERMGHV